ncbi:uncharacterized protein yc1106_08023 [Curvularia clavata]|uniref:Uncharacterized protein n=1 Tax=Curvularia clavata TaxID=95742 RepID=A0A9Q8ZFZ0_CURCL|nr:uncharacterized protein yc1106_08023 [Curvularia clavata]
MPPATRIATVEFRSLLLPPVRLPIRALQTLYRPQCAISNPRCAPPQCLTQRRGMNLYKTAKSKTLLGQHKALIFSPYTVEPPSASPHRINLFEGDKHHSNHTLIAKDVSLQEVYDNYVKDGYMIYSMQPLKKNMASDFKDVPEDDFPAIYKDYSFVHAHTHRVPMDSRQKGRQLGGLKNIIFNESSPTSYYRISMDRAYQFIEGGSPVEVRIRLQGKVSKFERHQPGDPTIWPWMHARFPHLRPDFIIKGMPEGTKFLINPVSDGRVCQWVMARPAQDTTQNLDEQFEKIKRRVTQSIKVGRQEMLPKLMRAQLVESGSADYSPHTGLPRVKARAKYAKGGDVTYGAEEKKRRAKDAEGAGFLVPDAEMVRKAEEDRAPRVKEDKADEKQGKRERQPAPWTGRGSRR